MYIIGPGSIKIMSQARQTYFSPNLPLLSLIRPMGISELQKQLARHKARHRTGGVVWEEGSKLKKKKKGFASLLYSSKDAEALDSETIRRKALESFQILSSSANPDLNQFAPLFLRNSSFYKKKRSFMSESETLKLDAVISSFLDHVAGFWQDEHVLFCLEALIRDYAIYRYNVDSLLSIACPFHDTMLFVRLISILELPSNSPFLFLEKTARSSMPLKRSVFVQNCIRRPALLSFLGTTVIRVYTNIPIPSLPLLSFFTICSMEALSDPSLALNESFIRQILPCLFFALERPNIQELHSAGLCILSQLAHRVTLTKQITDAAITSLFLPIFSNANFRSRFRAALYEGLFFLNLLIMTQTSHSKNVAACDTLSIIDIPSPVLKLFIRKINIPDLLDQIRSVAQHVEHCYLIGALCTGLLRLGLYSVKLRYRISQFLLSLLEFKSQDDLWMPKVRTTVCLSIFDALTNLTSGLSSAQPIVDSDDYLKNLIKPFVIQLDQYYPTCTATTFDQLVHLKPSTGSAACIVHHLTELLDSQVSAPLTSMDKNNFKGLSLWTAMSHNDNELRHEAIRAGLSRFLSFITQHYKDKNKKELRLVSFPIEIRLLSNTLIQHSTDKHFPIANDVFTSTDIWQYTPPSISLSHLISQFYLIFHRAAPLPPWQMMDNTDIVTISKESKITSMVLLLNSVMKSTELCQRLSAVLNAIDMVVHLHSEDAELAKHVYRSLAPILLPLAWGLIEVLDKNSKENDGHVVASSSLLQQFHELTFKLLLHMTKPQETSQHIKPLKKQDIVKMLWKTTDDDHDDTSSNFNKINSHEDCGIAPVVTIFLSGKDEHHHVYPSIYPTKGNLGGVWMCLARAETLKHYLRIQRDSTDMTMQSSFYIESLQQVWSLWNIMTQLGDDQRKMNGFVYCHYSLHEFISHILLSPQINKQLLQKNYNFKRSIFPSISELSPFTHHIFFLAFSGLLSVEDITNYIFDQHQELKNDHHNFVKASSIMTFITSIASVSSYKELDDSNAIESHVIEFQPSQDTECATTTTDETPPSMKLNEGDHQKEIGSSSIHSNHHGMLPPNDSMVLAARKTACDVLNNMIKALIPSPNILLNDNQINTFINRACIIAIITALDVTDDQFREKSVLIFKTLKKFIKQHHEVYKRSIVDNVKLNQDQSSMTEDDSSPLVPFGFACQPDMQKLKKHIETFDIKPLISYLIKSSAEVVTISVKSSLQRYINKIDPECASFILFNALSLPTLQAAKCLCNTMLPEVHAYHVIKPFFLPLWKACCNNALCIDNNNEETSVKNDVNFVDTNKENVNSQHYKTFFYVVSEVGSSFLKAWPKGEEHFERSTLKELYNKVIKQFYNSLTEQHCKTTIIGQSTYLCLIDALIHSSLFERIPSQIDFIQMILKTNVIIQSVESKEEENHKNKDDDGYIIKPNTKNLLDIVRGIAEQSSASIWIGLLNSLFNTLCSQNQNKHDNEAEIQHYLCLILECIEINFDTNKNEWNTFTLRQDGINILITYIVYMTKCLNTTDATHKENNVTLLLVWMRLMRCLASILNLTTIKIESLQQTQSIFEGLITITKATGDWLTSLSTVEAENQNSIIPHNIASKRSHEFKMRQQQQHQVSSKTNVINHDVINILPSFLLCFSNFSQYIQKFSDLTNVKEEEVLFWHTSTKMLISTLAENIMLPLIKIFPNLLFNESTISTSLINYIPKICSVTTCGQHHQNTYLESFKAIILAVIPYRVSYTVNQCFAHDKQASVVEKNDDCNKILLSEERCQTELSNLLNDIVILALSFHNMQATSLLLIETLTQWERALFSISKEARKKRSDHFMIYDTSVFDKGGEALYVTRDAWGIELTKQFFSILSKRSEDSSEYGFNSRLLFPYIVQHLSNELTPTTFVSNESLKKSEFVTIRGKARVAYICLQGVKQYLHATGTSTLEHTIFSLSAYELNHNDNENNRDDDDDDENKDRLNKVNDTAPIDIDKILSILHEEEHQNAICLTHLIFQLIVLTETPMKKTHTELITPVIKLSQSIATDLIQNLIYPMGDIIIIFVLLQMIESINQTSPPSSSSIALHKPVLFALSNTTINTLSDEQQQHFMKKQILTTLDFIIKTCFHSHLLDRYSEIPLNEEENHNEQKSAEQRKRKKSEKNDTMQLEDGNVIRSSSAQVLTLAEIEILVSCEGFVNLTISKLIQILEQQQQQQQHMVPILIELLNHFIFIWGSNLSSKLILSYTTYLMKTIQTLHKQYNSEEDYNNNAFEELHMEHIMRGIYTLSQSISGKDLLPVLNPLITCLFDLWDTLLSQFANRHQQFNTNDNASKVLLKALCCCLSALSGFIASSDAIKFLTSQHLQRFIISIFANQNFFSLTTLIIQQQQYTSSSFSSCIHLIESFIYSENVLTLVAQTPLCLEQHLFQLFYATTTSHTKSYDSLSRYLFMLKHLTLNRLLIQSSASSSPKRLIEPLVNFIKDSMTPLIQQYPPKPIQNDNNKNTQQINIIYHNVFVSSLALGILGKQLSQHSSETLLKLHKSISAIILTVIHGASLLLQNFPVDTNLENDLQKTTQIAETLSSQIQSGVIENMFYPENLRGNICHQDSIIDLTTFPNDTLINNKVFGFIESGLYLLIKQWLPKLNNTQLQNFIQPLIKYAKHGRSTFMASDEKNQDNNNTAESFSKQKVIVERTVSEEYRDAFSCRLASLVITIIGKELGDLGLLGTLWDIVPNIKQGLLASTANAFAWSKHCLSYNKASIEGGSKRHYRSACYIPSTLSWWWFDLGVPCLLSISELARNTPSWPLVDQFLPVILNAFETFAVLHRVNPNILSQDENFNNDTLTKNSSSSRHLLVHAWLYNCLLAGEQLFSAAHLSATDGSKIRLAIQQIQERLQETRNPHVKLVLIIFVNHLWKTLGLALLGTLSDILPLLAELVEDSDSHVESATKTLIKTIESQTGESLESRFQ